MINIKSSETSKINFPVARRSSSGTVVLFFGETEGIVLKANSSSNVRIGTYSDSWYPVNSSAWEPVNVEISG